MIKGIKGFIAVLFILLSLQMPVLGQWTQSDASLLGSKVSSLLAVGNDFFAASGTQRIFVSHDNGATWLYSGNGTTAECWSLATNGTEIFVGTDDGVFSSVDNGATWTSKGLAGTSIYDIAVDGNVIVAGSHGGGVYYSNNAGTTWTSVPLSASTTTITTVAIHGSTIFAAVYAAIYSSNDNGSTWSLSSTGMPSNAGVQSMITLGSKLYASTHGTGVYLSTDNGSSWNTVNNGITYSYISSLAKKDSLLIAGSNYYGVFLSSDSGSTWVDIGGNLPNADFPSIAIGNTHTIVGTSGSNRAWYRPTSQLITGIENTSSINNSLAVFPNPAREYFIVEVEKFNDSFMELYTAQGQLLKFISLSGPRTEVNINGLPAGVYFVRVQNSEGAKVRNIIVTN